jgi:DNA invertase Pin-like site-specific DNA recombinase
VDGCQEIQESVYRGRIHAQDDTAAFRGGESVRGKETNFDRPQFQRMIKDIEEHRIIGVSVKDMSWLP